MVSQPWSKRSPLISHPNARLNFRGRLLLVERVLKLGYSVPQAAASLGLSRASAYKWIRRFRLEGMAGLRDRSSRPHCSPRALTPSTVQAICSLRRQLGLGPVHLGWRLHLAPSTVYAVLRRAGLNRLSHLDRFTKVVVRYEHERPGDLLHLDVKKLWRIPPGGGRHFELKKGGGKSVPRSGKRGHGYDYLHVAIDDHSRYLYAELLPDQQGITTSGFLLRALDRLENLGVQVRRVLTDNAMNYRSQALLRLAKEHGIKLRKTRPYRPQTNGKAERVIQTLLREWAYHHQYSDNESRTLALSPYIEAYNAQRPHSALGGFPPLTRIRQQPL